VVSEQAAAAHTVPAGWSWHDRLPLHWPVLPQVEGAWAEHSLAGSWPAGTGSQKPARPGAAHVSQSPPQADGQQTPSTQNPLAQSGEAVQGEPLGRSSAHPPAPSQTPAPLHSSYGSEPCGINAQTPWLPGRSHAAHVEEQGESQHQPSAQFPEAQSDPDEHITTL
jgi:hypothetical protein